ncbi:MAG: phosphate ABC transporter permease PstA [Dehalococcoidia bacterium]|nr:phosphate ABC transporter permease PstA [Dehalococcoidia bacterium]
MTPDNAAASVDRFTAADPLYRRRKAIDRAMTAVMFAAAGATVVPLALILFYLFRNGLGAINLDLFLLDPSAPGRGGGGVRSALVGSAIMVGLGTAIGTPVAIGCGVFLAEFGRNRAGTVLRFLVDVLAGIPSITVGLFVYGLIVLPARQFTAFAGAVALAIILIPILARITEEMMLLVPRSLREAAYALGAPHWMTVLRIVLPTAMPGIMTGLMLALARIAGEAAPLMFTALGNQFLSTDLFHAMDALPLRIFYFATGPYENWHQQAWAMSLVLVLFILGVSLLARTIVGSKVTVRQ